MDLNQLSDLDFSDIGNWPVVAKAVLVVFLCGVVAGGWYWFVTLDQLDNLTRVEARETELRASFEAKQRLAANLEIHREQLVQIEEFLTDLLRQLPGSAEVAEVSEIPELVRGFEGSRLGFRLRGRGVAGRQGAGSRVRAGAV